MKYKTTLGWVYPQPYIRNRRIIYTDFEGDFSEDIEFQVFKKPYFFGLLGKKKWQPSIVTNNYNRGLNFSESLL